MMYRTSDDHPMMLGTIIHPAQVVARAAAHTASTAWRARPHGSTGAGTPLQTGLRLRLCEHSVHHHVHELMRVRVSHAVS